MKLRVDLNLVTLEDLFKLETPDLRFLRDFLAKFVIDDDGNFVSEEEAKELLNKLSVSEFVRLVKQMTEEVKSTLDVP